MTLQVTTFILKKTEKVPQKPQLNCPVCNRKYSCYKDLGSHLSTKHLSSVLKCSFCAETFESLQSQLCHEKRHEPFRFKCDPCKKSSQFQCELKQHSNIHLLNSKKFKCTSRNCNRRYTTLKALKLHTKLHDEVINPAANATKYSTPIRTCLNISMVCMVMAGWLCVVQSFHGQNRCISIKGIVSHIVQNIRKHLKSSNELKRRLLK